MKQAHWLYFLILIISLLFWDNRFYPLTKRFKGDSTICIITGTFNKGFKV